MDVERLIECVKDHVYLYDTKHKDYKNFALKSAVWEAIAKDLRQTCDAVKLKWKTIRDGYIKYKKQLKDSATSGRRIYDYVWKTQLAFLDKHSVTRNSKANKAKSIQYQEDSQGEPSYSPKLTEAHTSHDSQSPFEANTEQRPKRKADSDVDKILNYLVKKKERKYDAVDYLFMSYAETFKNFSLRTQTELKLELANIFLNAELKEIKNAEDLQKSTAQTQSSDSCSSCSDSDNEDNSQSEQSTVNVKVEKPESPDYNEHQF